jgi:hypothetical protein
MTILGITEQEQHNGQMYANNIVQFAGAAVVGSRSLRVRERKTLNKDHASSAYPLAAVGNAEQQWNGIPIRERWATILAINYFLRTKYILKGVGIIKDFVTFGSLFDLNLALTAEESIPIPITMCKTARTLLLTIYSVTTKIRSNDIETHWKNNVGKVTEDLERVDNSKLSTLNAFKQFTPEVLLEAHTILTRHGLNTIKGQLTAGFRTCTDNFILTFFGTTLFEEIREEIANDDDPSAALLDYLI